MFSEDSRVRVIERERDNNTEPLKDCRLYSNNNNVHGNLEVCCYFINNPFKERLIRQESKACVALVGRADKSVCLHRRYIQTVSI